MLRYLCVCLVTFLCWRSAPAQENLTLEKAAAASAQLSRALWIDALEPTHPWALILATDWHVLNEVHQRSRRYTPPKAVDGRLWGEPRSAFHDLQPSPFSVRVMPDPEHGELHVLAEYIDGDRGWFHDPGPDRLPPVSYMFCARTVDEGHYSPINMLPLLRFCGLRMLFRNESGDALLALKDVEATKYEVLLAYFREHLGDPDHFPQNFTEGAVVPPRERVFPDWRWCEATNRDLIPSCSVSVVLQIDPQEQLGIALLGTPLLYEFARVSRLYRLKDDPLNAVLHGKRYTPPLGLYVGLHVLAEHRPHHARSSNRLPDKDPLLHGGESHQHPLHAGIQGMAVKLPPAS